MNETIPTTGINVSEEKKAEGPSIRWTRLLVWLVIAALLGLLGWGLINTNAPRPEAGVVAPTFDAQLFDGYEWGDFSRASLADMKGNVVVLNFWASWCVECRLEADLLENAWRQYRDQGVVFVGVAHVDSEPKSLAYLQEFGITYPNGPDLGGTIANDYEITGVPETFIIDQDGVVSDVIIGPVSANRLYGQLENLLARQNTN